MTSPAPLTYHHTQKARWYVLLYALAAVFLAIGWLARSTPVLNITFLGTGALMALLGISFHHLTVSDEGNQLAIRFGPFPLFRKRIWYDAIREAEKERTTFFDGWGIHLSLRGGWVWNIWGYDCVVLRFDRGIFTVGTDDPDGLVAFLRTRIPQAR